MTVKTTGKTSRTGGGVLALLLAVILLAIFKLLPALMSLIMSFQDYSPVRGLLNSAWVGFENYQRFFASYHFSVLVKNSLMLGVLSNLLPLALGTVIGFFTARHIPDKLAGIGLAGWLLPVFIPKQIYGALVGWLGGAQVLGMPGPSTVAYLVCNGIPLLCLTAFVTGCCGWLTRRQKKGLSGVLMGGLAMGAMTLASMFSPDRELLSTLQNSLNYESTDVLNTYIYRTGMMEAAYSSASATWITLLALQLPGLLIGALLLMMGLRYLKQQKPQEAGTTTSPAAITGAVLALVAALVITLLFVTLMPGSLPSSIGAYLFSSILRTVLGTAAALALMTLLAAGTLSLPRVGLIVPLVVVWLGQNLVAEYMLFRQLGLYNTYLPDAILQPMNGSLLLPMVLLVLLAAGKEGFSLRKVLPFLILFGGLFAAQIWGSSLYSTVYLMDQEKYDLAMMIKELVIVNGTPTAPSFTEGGGLTLLLSLYGILPVVLGAVCIGLFGCLVRPKSE